MTEKYPNVEERNAEYRLMWWQQGIRHFSHVSDLMKAPMKIFNINLNKQGLFSNRYMHHKQYAASDFMICVSHFQRK